MDEPEDMVIRRRKPPQEDIQPEVVVAMRTVTTIVGSVQSAPSKPKLFRTGRDQQEVCLTTGMHCGDNQTIFLTSPVFLA